MITKEKYTWGETTDNKATYFKVVWIKASKLKSNSSKNFKYCTLESVKLLQTNKKPQPSKVETTKICVHKIYAIVQDISSNMEDLIQKGKRQ